MQNNRHAETFLWVREGYLSKETCENLIKEYYNDDTATSAAYKVETGEYVDGSRRDAKVCWASEHSPLGLLLFSEMLLANQKSGWLFDIDKIQPVQLAKYVENGNHDWHWDDPVCLRDNTGIQRKLSVSVLLSDPDDYEGGDMEFLEVGKNVTRKQGSVIVFPSSVYHRVTPITKGTRYTAVAWATGPYFK